MQGTLKNGKVIAVKKLSLGQSARAISEFEGEVKLLSNVHHRNLVRLLGCCNKGPERLLVYEYMPNSSLDRVLFGWISHLLLSEFYFFLARTEVKYIQWTTLNNCNPCNRRRQTSFELGNTFRHYTGHCSRACISARRFPCTHHSSRYQIQQYIAG